MRHADHHAVIRVLLRPLHGAAVLGLGPAPERVAPVAAEQELRERRKFLQDVPIYLSLDRYNLVPLLTGDKEY